MKPERPSAMLRDALAGPGWAERGLNAQTPPTWGPKPEPDPVCGCKRPLPLRRYSGQWLCVCGQFVTAERVALIEIRRSLEAVFA